MVVRSNTNIGKLDDLIARYNAMSPVNAETVQAITQEYLGLSGLNTQITVDNQERDWSNLIRP